MSVSTQSLSELASSIHVKQVLSFSLNAQFLQHNFTILKQCLLKLQELQGNFGQQKQSLGVYSKRLNEVQKGLAENKKNQENQSEKIKQLQGNVGDQFMKKMYGIEEKTKNMFTFDDTVSKLTSLDLFVTKKAFKQSELKTQGQIQQVKNIRNEFQRYVTNAKLDSFRQQQKAIHSLHERKVQDLQLQLQNLHKEIAKAKQKVDMTNKQSQQNSKMLKEINFPDMMEKNRKFKEEMDQKINELVVKMKKKVGTNELVALEQTMIEKLDRFLSQNQKSKAQKNETRDALIFLEKRISQIQEFFTQKASQDDKDALFSVKQIHCASCTKDLGKFQGKLGQYKPWSVFPCRQLDPEKIGAFGYMSYLDKVQNKKGSNLDDPNFDRLNRTAVDKERQNSPKRGSSTARGSNVITNFGTEDKGGSSLKDVYFRQLRTEKGQRNGKVFRIKKQSAKPTEQFERFKE